MTDAVRSNASTDSFDGQNPGTKNKTKNVLGKQHQTILLKIENIRKIRVSTQKKELLLPGGIGDNLP